MHLRPEEQDSYLRTVNTAFSIDRTSSEQGEPNSNLYNTMRTVFQTLEIKPQTDKRTTLINRVVTAANSENLNIQQIQELLAEETADIIGENIDYEHTTTGEEVNADFINSELGNSSVIFIKNSRPDDLSMYVQSYLLVEPDQLSYFHQDGREENITTNATEFFERLTELRARAFEQKNASLHPRLRLTSLEQINSIPLAPDEIESLITTTTGFQHPAITNQDIVETILGYCAPNAFDTVIESPFANINESDHDSAIERLSIITQFFLGEVNVFCVANGLTTANFGEIIDESAELSQEIASRIFSALTENACIEQTLISFINEYRDELQLISQITTEQMQIINQRFATDFAEIKDSVHFDEFMLIDKTPPGLFNEHQGALTISFADFACHPIIEMDCPFFESVIEDRATWESCKLSHESPHIAADIEIDIEQINLTQINALVEILSADELSELLTKILTHRLNDFDMTKIYQLLKILPKELRSQVIAKTPDEKYTEIDEWELETLTELLSPEDLTTVIAKIPGEVFNGFFEFSLKRILEKVSANNQITIFNKLSTTTMLRFINEVIEDTAQAALFSKISFDIFKDLNTEDLLMYLPKLDTKYQVKIIEQIPEQTFAELSANEFLVYLPNFSYEVQVGIIAKIPKATLQQISAEDMVKLLAQLSPDDQALAIDKAELTTLVTNEENNTTLFQHLESTSAETQVKVIGLIPAATLAGKITSTEDIAQLGMQIKQLLPDAQALMLEMICRENILEQSAESELYIHIKDIDTNAANIIIRKICPGLINREYTEIINFLCAASPSAQSIVLSEIPEQKFATINTSELSAITMTSETSQALIIAQIEKIELDSNFLQGLLDDLASLHIEHQGVILNKISAQELIQVGARNLLTLLTKLPPENLDIVLENLKTAIQDFSPEQQQSVNEVINACNFARAVQSENTQEVQRILEENSSPDANRPLICEDFALRDSSGRNFSCTAYEYALWHGNLSMYNLIKDYVHENIPSYKRNMKKNVKSNATEGLTYEYQNKTYKSPYYACSFSLQNLSEDDFRYLAMHLRSNSTKLTYTNESNYQSVRFTHEEYMDLKEMTSESQDSFEASFFSEETRLQKIGRKLTYNFENITQALQNYTFFYDELNESSNQERKEKIQRALDDAPEYIRNIVTDLDILDLTKAQEYQREVETAIEQTNIATEEIFALASKPIPYSSRPR